MNILMIVAPENFRDEEYSVPYQYFRNNNFHVDIASIKRGVCIGKFGARVEANIALDEVDSSKYDAIIFIGGPGTPSIRRDIDSVRIAKSAFEQGKIIGAICWAPTILAKAGILKNRRATVWQGNDSEFGMMTSEYLEKNGAFYTGESVTKEGNIITADGPDSAAKFADAIIELLNLLS